MAEEDALRVHLLTREGRDYPDDPSRPMQIHGVYETEEDAQHALARDVRAALHYEYSIEEWEVERVER